LLLFKKTSWFAHKLTGLLIMAQLGGITILQADQSDRQNLFKIERNKNANIVQYDAQVTVDGKLNSEEPVIVYWVRLAEQGQVEELGWLQRKFAFGFSTDFDQESDTAIIDMALKIERPITIKRIEGDYQAIMAINGKTSRIEKIFIDSSGKGFSTRVNFIEMHGTDMETSEITYERLVP
jgi:hypothetical protein